MGGKYGWLWGNSLETTEWLSLKCESPEYHFFERAEEALEEEYLKGFISLKDACRTSGWGVATRKDYLLVDFAERDLTDKFRAISLLSSSDALTQHKITVSKHWDWNAAHSSLKEDGDSNVIPYYYRPYDKRYIYYSRAMIERGDHRWAIARHMLSAERI